MIARCRVLESEEKTPSVHNIRIEKPTGFDFAPVQFCGLELETAEGAQEYSMSLACSPTKPYLEFGARISPSPWKTAFRALKPGDTVEIDGPYGHFVLDQSRDAVFIAGGIGITPLKGMMEFAADRDLPTRITLLYSNRSETEIAYRAELEALVPNHPRLKVMHTLTRDPPPGWAGRTGRVDVAMLRDATDGLMDPKYYICGLPEMVRGVGTMLVRELQVPRERLVVEQFWGYE